MWTCAHTHSHTNMNTRTHTYTNMNTHVYTVTYTHINKIHTQHNIQNNTAVCKGCPKNEQF